MSTAFSFSQEKREVFTGRNYSPGPTAYDDSHGLKVIKDQPPNWSFSKTNRPEDGDDNPGPGSYDYPENKLHGQSFSHGGSRTAANLSPNRQSIEGSPGPGAYDLQSRTKSPQYSMGSKRKEERDSKIPGPGSYEKQPSSNQQKYGKSAFGSTSKRDTMKALHNHSRSMNQSLGPGSYDAQSSIVKSNNPTFGFSKGKRGTNHKDLSPGPGAYDDSSIKALGNNVPKISFQGRPKTAKPMDLPGPGQYEQSSGLFSPQKSSRSFLSTAPRTTTANKEKLLSPGPGAYDANSFINRDKTPSMTFGKTQRADIIGKEEKAKLGPGNYDLSHKKPGPSFTIGSKIQQKIKTDVPGPGNYDPSLNAVKDTIKSAKMGRSARNNELVSSKSVSQLPGPGNYYVSQDFAKSAQKVKIAGRPKDLKKDNNPGPGAYDAKDNLIKSFTPSVVQGKSKRTELVSKMQSEMPGPGNYSFDYKAFGNDAPKVSIYGKPKDSRNIQSPGPGEYEPTNTQTRDKVVTYKMASSNRSELISQTARDQPGPGMYDSPIKIGKGGPSFAMQGKARDLKTLEVPGPGSYAAADSVLRDKSPSFRMGTSSRGQMVSKQQLELPGPGMYQNSESTFGKNAPSFTIQSKADSKVKSEAPGPGAYDPNMKYIKDDVIGYKMSNTSRTNLISKETASMPGPGNYTEQKGFGQGAQTFTIQGKERQRSETNVPGPGEYDPSQPHKDRVISYKLGQSQRTELITKEVAQLPGPGIYESPSKFGRDGQRYTIGGKKEQSYKTLSPGPGAYEPKDALVKDSASTIAISKTKREDIVSKQAKEQPGPGIYDQKSFFGQGQSISIHGRPKDRVVDDIPAPGTYDPSQALSKDNVISYKMSSSTRQDIVSKESKNLPGPGNYGSPSKPTSTTTYTMGGKGQPQRDNKMPGPGQYEPSDALIKDKIQAASMSKSQRADIISKNATEMPGPGIYESPSKLGTGPHFTIGGKTQQQRDSQIPGPGQYEPVDTLIKDKIQAASMSKSLRADIISKSVSELPGPGNYNESSRTFGGKDTKSVTILGKPSDIRHDNIPGPGVYDPNSSVGKFQSPSFKMGASTRSELISGEAKNLPGPGNYDKVSSFGNGPSFQIQGKPSDMRDSGLPGPGSYDARFDVLKDSNPSFKVSQSKRDFLTVRQDDIHPGPGSYDRQNKPSGPFFTIPEKHNERIANDIPGPGQYEQNPSAVRDRIPSANFSRSPDRSRMSNSGSPQREQLPGPGQYDARDYNVLSGKQSIVYSFTKSEPHDQMEGTPGPGYYKLPCKFADVPSYSMPNRNDEFKYV